MTIIFPPSYILLRHHWISLPAACTLLVLEAERGDDSLAWRDLLSAVARQEPRLRHRLTLDSRRQELLERVVELYTTGLGVPGPRVEVTSASETETEVTDSDTVEVARRRQLSCSDHVVPSYSCPPSPALSSCLHSPQPLPSPTGSCSSVDSWGAEGSQPSLTSSRYQQMKTDILAAAGGLGGSIGDWEVVRADTTTRLRVRPGYGASRKVSFLRPDYAAILAYSLTLAPGHVVLALNDCPIPADVMMPMLEREEREGTLSFLYQLISLRPCFGSFSPELVETVRQWDDDTVTKEQVMPKILYLR